MREHLSIHENQILSGAWLVSRRYAGNVSTLYHQTNKRVRIPMLVNDKTVAECSERNSMIKKERVAA